MIAVNISQGLANQMFHYAFGRGLIHKGFDVVFDQTNYPPQSPHETIKLQDVFPGIEMKLMPKGHFKYVFPLPKNRIHAMFLNYMRNFHNKKGDEVYIDETSFAYIDGIEQQITRNCIFRGNWQSEKYFSHCKDDIKKQFTFLPLDEERNINIAKKMQMENSVAIHLRKGKDYLNNIYFGKGLCPVEYYISAIDYIKSHITSPTFYVFTDNPSWVQENLPNFGYTLINWNNVTGTRSFRDMQLMTFAKHNIICNSTYSWWGAWLNPNKDKIVIAPKKWVHPIHEYFRSTDIICDNWVRI